MIFTWHKGNNFTKVSLTLSIHSNHLGQGWCWCLNGRAEHRRVKTAREVPGLWGSLGPCLTWDIHRENLWADPFLCYLHRGIQPRRFGWGIFHEIYDIYIYIYYIYIYIYSLLLCTCHMYIYFSIYIYVCIYIYILYDMTWYDLIWCDVIYIYTCRIWYDMI